jgi:hypothetical protein
MRGTKLLLNSSCNQLGTTSLLVVSVRCHQLAGDNYHREPARAELSQAMHVTVTRAGAANVVTICAADIAKIHKHTTRTQSSVVQWYTTDLLPRQRTENQSCCNLQNASHIPARNNSKHRLSTAALCSCSANSISVTIMHTPVQEYNRAQYPRATAQLKCSSSIRSINISTGQIPSTSKHY